MELFLTAQRRKTPSDWHVLNTHAHDFVNTAKMSRTTFHRGSLRDQNQTCLVQLSRSQIFVITTTTPLWIQLKFQTETTVDTIYTPLVGIPAAPWLCCSKSSNHHEVLSVKNMAINSSFQVRSFPLVFSQPEM